MPCVAEVVERSLKADCTDFKKTQKPNKEIQLSGNDYFSETF